MSSISTWVLFLLKHFEWYSHTLSSTSAMNNMEATSWKQKQNTSHTNNNVEVMFNQTKKELRDKNRMKSDLVEVLCASVMKHAAIQESNKEW